MPSMPSSHVCSSSLLKQQIINTVEPFKKGCGNSNCDFIRKWESGNPGLSISDPCFREIASIKEPSTPNSWLLIQPQMVPTNGSSWFPLCSQACCSSLVKQQNHQLSRFTIQEVMCIKGSSMELLSMPPMPDSQACRSSLLRNNKSWIQ